MASLLFPSEADTEAHGRLLRRAVEVRAGGSEGVESWLAHIQSELAAGRLVSRLVRVDGTSCGVASWAPAPPLGTNLQLLFLDDSSARPTLYAEVLEEVARTAGQLALAPGPLSGIPTSEEERLMTALGFARFGRSEMRLAPETPLPEPGPAAVGSVRPISPDDEPALAELHRRAYHNRFDHYLFMDELDESANARREMRDLMGGRWGLLEPSGSVVLEVEGELVGAVVAVKRPDGVLIADVAVEPARQGHGLGQRVLLESLRGLRGAGASAIYLNVTEGNRSAQKLYERLGFVRTLGPSKDWYNTAAIPVSPVDAD